MSAKKAAAKPPSPEGGDTPSGKGKGGKKKLIIMVLPVLLAGVGAGLWFSGILPSMLGGGGTHEAEAAGAGAHGNEAAKEPAKEHGKEPAKEHGKEAAKEHGKEGAHGEQAKGNGPVFLDLPEMVANLNAGPRRTSYLKLRSKIELAKGDDPAAVTAAMPRLVDLFQTYLREMRPEELRGAAGTYRLREELIARASLAVAPARVVDVLFTEVLVQ